MRSTAAKRAVVLGFSLQQGRRRFEAYSGSKGATLERPVKSRPARTFDAVAQRKNECRRNQKSHDKRQTHTKRYNSFKKLA